MVNKGYVSYTIITWNTSTALIDIKCVKKNSFHIISPLMTQWLYINLKQDRFNPPVLIIDQISDIIQNI